MENRLIHEDSPYLKQHANNPVHWLAWNKEAFKKAKDENKLIFLSIGYSTCHWCHVMERESFEDEAVAKFLNAHFISIKVDREEMPHIDKYYQDMHSLLQKRAGGWPLTIFMTPEKKVVFAATYLPKNSRQHMMGFLELLNFLASKYKKEPHEFHKSAASIEEAYNRYKNYKSVLVDLDMTVITNFIKNIEKNFDPIYKGIGNAPKFPHASTWNTLLDIYMLTGNQNALTLAKDALHAMMQGGICDQIEGGFYRYSVDEAWQIPHFEKMLYTNAELLESYSKLFAITKDNKYKQVAFEIVNAINERFLNQGLYFSASDADSQGNEGKYFVFSHKKAYKVLVKNNFSEQEANEILKYFHITEQGNFEKNTTNPYVTTVIKPKKLDLAKKALKELRLHEEYPFIDTKVLTSWNSLFIKALFIAGRYVDRDFNETAFNALEQLLNTVHKNEILYHQYIFGASLKVKGLLEDYAYLCDALIMAYSTSGEEKYLLLANQFSKKAKEKFYKNLSWQLGEDFESVASLEDSAYKSSLATMIGVFATLALLNDDIKMFEEANKMLYVHSGNLSKYPHAYPEAIKTWLKLQKHELVLKIPKEYFSSSNETFQKILHPFIYTKKYKEDTFQGCNLGQCFTNSTNLKQFIENLENYITNHV